MTKQQKIVIQQLGESFRDCTSIVDDEQVEPGPGELRVRNHFAGVNGVYDQMMCLNRVEHTQVDPPCATGVEAVGVIEALGEGVEGFAIDDPVAVVQVGGAYRHVQICKTENASLIPAISPGALAIVPSAVSALIALEQVAEMKAGQLMCITAAAGGLGNALVQLALMADNRVIAVCGTDEKAAWLESLGVERVVQYRRESLSEVVTAQYADQLDIVMDSVGGETFDALLPHLAPHGKLVSCGYTSDRLPTERVQDERIYTRLYWKAASVRGFMNYRFAEFAPHARERLFQWWSEDRWAPKIDQKLFTGLQSVPDAVEWLLAGRNLGKVVVDLREA